MALEDNITRIQAGVRRYREASARAQAGESVDLKAIGREILATIEMPRRHKQAASIFDSIGQHVLASMDGNKLLALATKNYQSCRPKIMTLNGIGISDDEHYTPNVAALALKLDEIVIKKMIGRDWIYSSSPGIPGYEILRVAEVMKINHDVLGSFGGWRRGQFFC